LKFIAKIADRNVNVSKTHPLQEFAILAGGLLTIAVVVYFLLGLAVDQIVSHLSPEYERKLGSVFMQRFMEEGKADKRTLALQTMVDRLQSRCAPLPFRVQVHVQQGKSVNAMALPGGHIIVFSGLLDVMESENEIGFVLAHEIGHIVNRDHLRGLGRGLVLMTASTFLLGTDSNITGMIGNGMRLSELTFSRAQETHADDFAQQVLVCLYGHVGGAEDFFSKIPEEQDPGRLGHYFASHPENKRRIAHLRQTAREKGYTLKDPKPLPAQFAHR